MKQIKFILACIALMTSGCLTVPEPLSPRTIQKTYDVPGLSQKQIYDKSLEWMAKTFVSSKEVIDLKDSDNGKIIGHGVTTFTQSVSGPINCRYTIIIDVKKEKVRLTFQSFTGFFLEGEFPLSNMNQFNQIEHNLIVLSENLATTLKKPAENNW